MKITRIMLKLGAAIGGAGLIYNAAAINASNELNPLQKNAFKVYGNKIGNAYTTYQDSLCDAGQDFAKDYDDALDKYYTEIDRILGL